MDADTATATHAHIDSGDQFLCRIGMCPDAGTDESVAGLGWRYAFWQRAHDMAERIWNWIYTNKLSKMHGARPPLTRAEMRHGAFTRYAVYAHEHHYLLYIATMCLRCPREKRDGCQWSDDPPRAMP